MIERNIPVLAYKKWLTKTGKEILVKPIAFLSYYKNSKGNIIYFHLDDKIYEGQRWRCLCMEDKVVRNYVFRIEISQEDFKHRRREHVDATRDSVQHDFPNSIIHTIEEFLTKKFIPRHKKWDGHHYFIREQDRIRRIKKANPVGTSIYLDWIQSPTLSSLAKWNTFKRNRPDEYKIFKKCLLQIIEDLDSVFNTAQTKAV